MDDVWQFAAVHVLGYAFKALRGGGVVVVVAAAAPYRRTVCTELHHFQTLRSPPPPQSRLAVSILTLSGMRWSTDERRLATSGSTLEVEALPSFVLPLWAASAAAADATLSTAESRRAARWHAAASTTAC